MFNAKNNNTNMTILKSLNYSNICNIKNTHYSVYKQVFVIEVLRFHIFLIDLNLIRKKKHVHYCNGVKFN